MSAEQSDSFQDMPDGAFVCEEDARIMAVMKKIKGLEWTAREITRKRYEKYARLAFTAGCSKAGQNSFEELGAIFGNVCRKLGVDKPDLFVRNCADPDASIIGEQEPMVVVTAGALELLDEKELVALLGHVVSHIRCGHLPYLAMRELAAAAADNLGILKGAVSWPRMLLEEWKNKAEISCDRGALLATGDLAAVLGMLSKFSAGAGGKYGSVTPEALLVQSEEYDQLTEDTPGCQLFKTWSSLYVGLPRYAARAGAVSRWEESPQYTDILAGRYAFVTEPEVSEEDARIYWGAFAGGGEAWESCDTGGEDFVFGFGGIADGVKEAAGNAEYILETGAQALGKAAGTFMDSMRKAMDDIKKK